MTVTVDEKDIQWGEIEPETPPEAEHVPKMYTVVLKYSSDDSRRSQESFEMTAEKAIDTINNVLLGKNVMETDIDGDLVFMPGGMFSHGYVRDNSGGYGYASTPVSVESLQEESRACKKARAAKAKTITAETVYVPNEPFL